ncbi:MAG TPA: hypothetical protein VK714_05750 [Myxococcota bacterium]|nr:hypothetical protein [Myxococcota bacterium]
MTRGVELERSDALRARPASHAAGDTQACLQGTIDGQPFQGCAAVVVVNPLQIKVEPNPIAVTNPPPVSVTVLGSIIVDVTKIDVAMLRFGPKGATPG